jgi:nitrite reductase/ring-hydroxylating ferredoxin subunit
MPWVRAAKASDVIDGALLAVVCEGQPLVLSRSGGEYFALFDRCPHQGAPLSEGCLVDGFIECPRHFALFDVRNGNSDGSVTMHGVRTFPTRLVDDMIEVNLDTDGQGRGESCSWDRTTSAPASR